ncbi:hypothetical protein K438DRAFT_1987140 [Mycena galopus ATCC 62051]|nr:hypothetical protein K438DRAFT_1987140 [Mycena galopus ATCC 62051]
MCFPTAFLPPTTTSVSTALAPRSLRRHRARRRQDKGAALKPGPLQCFDAGADADINALAQRRLGPAPERSPLLLERKNRHLQRTVHLLSCGTPANTPAFFQFTVCAPAAWKRVQRTVTRHPSQITRVS